MAYRVLIDENVDPATVALLDDRGHEAVHVVETLGKGTPDPAIADHAREHDCLLLTNDADFLRPDRRQGFTVLYVPENAMRAHQIATFIDALGDLIPDQADLPAVTWLSDELRS